MKKVWLVTVSGFSVLALVAGRAEASVDLGWCQDNQSTSAVSPAAEEIAAHRRFTPPVIHYKGRIELGGGFYVAFLVDAKGKPVCVDSFGPPESPPESPAASPPTPPSEAPASANSPADASTDDDGATASGVMAMTSTGLTMTPERRRVLQAAKAWRYAPFLKAGVAVPALVREHFDEVVDPGATPMPQGRLFTTTISLDRSNCFGTCPSYRVTVRGDGQVTYSGDGYTNVRGKFTYQISPGAAAALFERLRARDLWSMRAAYQAGVTDNPTYQLSMTIGGQTKTVIDYVGRAAGMPKAVTTMENDIDATSGATDLVTLTQRGLAVLEQNHFDFKGPPGARLLIDVLQDDGVSDQTINAVLDHNPPLSRAQTMAKTDDIRLPFEKFAALDAALASGREALVPRLIQSGALLKDGRPDPARIDSAFQYAIIGGRENQVEVLWAWHPALTYKSSNDPGFGEKVKSVAAPVTLLLFRDGTPDKRWQDFAIARFLIGQGCDINGKDAKGRTLLMAAADADDPAYVGWVLAHGADIKPVDDDGENALSKTYDEDTALVLLEAGADPTVQPQYGRTFFALVSSEKWPRVTDWLQHHGYAAQLKAADAS